METKKSEGSVDINEFLEEMISMIDARLRKQEKAIASLEAEVGKINTCLSVMPTEVMKIDKSVLKVLKQ